MALGEGDEGGDVHSMAASKGGGHAIGTSVMKGYGQARSEATASKSGNANANAFQIGAGQANPNPEDFEKMIDDAIAEDAPPMAGRGFGRRGGHGGGGGGGRRHGGRRHHGHRRRQPHVSFESESDEY